MSILTQPCTAFILSVFIPGAVGSLVFRHGHQLICLMKVELFWCSEMKRRFLQLHTLMSRLWNVKKTLFYFGTPKYFNFHETYQLVAMSKH